MRSAGRMKTPRELQHPEHKCLEATTLFDSTKVTRLDFMRTR